MQALGFADDTIHFPMPEGSPGVYFIRAVFDTSPLWGPGSRLDMGILSLTSGHLQEVLGDNARNIALVDIAVKSGNGDGPLALTAEGMDNGSRRLLLLDLFGHIVRVGVIFSQFDFRALRSGVVVRLLLADIGGVMPGAAGTLCAHMGVQGACHLPMDGGGREPQLVGDIPIAMPRIPQGFNFQTVCHSHSAIAAFHW